MITILARLFIKNHTAYTDSVVREKYGVLCGSFGIFLNVILFLLKFVFGSLSGSVAMVADAFNNLSDAASSLVQILGFKLSVKKPDSEHPFGHGRIEYISGLIISFLILLMGCELLKSSLRSLIHPEPVEFSIISLGVLFFAILVKFYMYIYNHSVARKISSVSMEATAKDSLSDMISTLVVIASVVAGRFTSFPVDGVAGCVVGVFILKTGYESARETIAPLLGKPPSREFVKEVEKELLRHRPISGMHDIVVHDYGPGRRMISLHAEVPGNGDIFELHDVIDNAEVSIAQKFGCQVVIHLDPVKTDNPQLDELKELLRGVLSEISQELCAHDIRMVPGPTHTNLIFDVVKPFSFCMSDDELKKRIASAVRARKSDVNCVITVDCPFV